MTTATVPSAPLEGFQRLAEPFWGRPVEDGADNDCRRDPCEGMFAFDHARLPAPWRASFEPLVEFFDQLGERFVSFEGDDVLDNSGAGVVQLGHRCTSRSTCGDPTLGRRRIVRGEIRETAQDYGNERRLHGEPGWN